MSSRTLAATLLGVLAIYWALQSFVQLVYFVTPWIIPEPTGWRPTIWNLLPVLITFAVSISLLFARHRLADQLAVEPSREEPPLGTDQLFSVGLGLLGAYFLIDGFIRLTNAILVELDNVESHQPFHASNLASAVVGCVIGLVILRGVPGVRRAWRTIRATDKWDKNPRDEGGKDST